jgi:hypothetical protein
LSGLDDDIFVVPLRDWLLVEDERPSSGSAPKGLHPSTSSRRCKQYGGNAFDSDGNSGGSRI